MASLLLLTPAELTRDPRARRAAAAARRVGLDVVGVCVAGEAPVPIEDVTVIRVAPDPLSARRRRDAAAEPAGGRRIVREAHGLFRLTRLLRTTLWLARAARGREPEIVHANDFETLPAAAWLARGGRARLVYDAHELYTAFEPRPPRLHAALLRRLEGVLARRADAVVTVSPEIAARLRAIHRLGTTPLVALNCPPLTELGATRAPAPGSLLGVVYQAAAGPGRVVDDLLDAVRVADGARVTVRVVGADARAIADAAASRGVSDRVEVVAPVTQDELVPALARYEVGVVIDRPATANIELALPNKLFEYLMAGLAVVVPRLAAMGELVERDGVGLTYEPGRPDDLGRALTELGADRPRLGEMRRRARQLAVERYNAEAQEPVLLQAWGL